LNPHIIILTISNQHQCILSVFNLKLKTWNLKLPLNNATLNNLLTAYKKVKPDPGDPKPIPMTKQVAYLRTTRSYMEMGTWQYTKPDLQTYLDELLVLVSLVEQKVQTAPEPAPGKPVKKKLPQM
jgi:hypothetical protein